MCYIVEFFSGNVCHGVGAGGVDNEILLLTRRNQILRRILCLKSELLFDVSLLQ